MWRPLSWILETIAGIRLYQPPGWTTPAVGSAGATDASGGRSFEAFRSSRALYDLWGPVPDSPYEPYHCATLFAALDRMRSTAEPMPSGPAEVALYENTPALEAAGPPLEPLWLVQGVMVVVDLPGPSTVALGAKLVARGCQPVCTFDNWPHPHANLRPEAVLAMLLRHAPVVAAARAALLPGAPPVWLCDADRLSGSRPSPGRFDNRYFLDDTVLPGTAVLRGAGIGRIVVVKPEGGTALQKDVAAWLADRAKDGFEVYAATADDPALDLRAIQPAREHFPQVGSRADAGGFGTLIPEPSSSGG